MLNPQIQLLTFQLLIWLANCDNFSPSNKPREIISIINNIAQLPCPIGSLDDSMMILWFKDSSGSPIYSYDARVDKAPRHLTMQNDWGLRLYFRVWPNLRRSPALIIKDIQPNDEGLYRCRVDYRNAPTTNVVMQLIVIQPPSHLEILDNSPIRPISDQQMITQPHYTDITYMGPYREGQSVSLKCNAYGGKPLPEVKWLRNGAVIDASYEFVGSNYVVNELQITNLSNEHLGEVFTCQASNNNESKAIFHSVNLDIYIGVKEVDLVVPDEMTAGVQQSLTCTSHGAYPTVKIEFWKMQKRLSPKFQMRSDTDNVTTYKFQYKPEIGDDDMTISCKAENPWLNENPMVATKTLKIKYTPVAILRFGQNKTANFSEGEAVLMECHVKANPPIFSITWFHGNKELINDESSGVRITGMTLILTNLKSYSGGKYFCQAGNVIGKEMSNPLTIELNIAPKCASQEEPSNIPLAIGESHKLECFILAWPPNLNFYWTLNRSNDMVPILPMASQNHGQGTIEDIPLEEFDEYIFPITKRVKDLVLAQDVSPTDADRDGGRGSNFVVKNFGGSSSVSQRRNERVVTDTEEWKGGWMVGKAQFSHHQTQDYLRMRKKSSQIHGKELKSLDKKEGLKGSDELIHPGVTWNKAPEDTDNIHHASLSYTIRSIEDYGKIQCWGRNSYGKQLSPCTFNVFPRKEANQDEAVGERGKGGLTRGSFQTREDVGPQDQWRESGILVPSKLPMTSGIILIVLLIFIALLSLTLFLLLMLAKRRRQMQGMIMTNKKLRGEPSAEKEASFSLRDPPLSGQVGSSAIEKCTSSISLSRNGSCSLPLCTMSKELGAKDSGASSCLDLSSSDTTTFTIISNQNDFPPPPTSIISTASTSHGYGSIEEDEEEVGGYLY